jgi:hypothetical protein
MNGKIVREHERYSEFVPEYLQERYTSLLDDPLMMQLNQEIALLSIKVQAMLQRLNEEQANPELLLHDIQVYFPDETPELVDRIHEYVTTIITDQQIDYKTFKKLSSLVGKYEEYVLSKQISRADGVLRHLFRTIREGRREGDVWDDVSTAIKERRELVEAQQRIIVQQDQVIPVDKAILLLAATINSLRGAVIQYVKDSEVQRNILVDAEKTYRKLIGEQDTHPNGRVMDAIN